MILKVLTTERRVLLDRVNELIAQIHTLHPAIFLASIFFMALLASPHCLSMCGVFCLASTKEKRWYTAIYHSGRLVTYLFLGFLFSLIGESLVSQMQPFFFFIAISIFFLLLLFASKKAQKLFLPLQWLSSKLLAKAQKLNPKAQAFVIGLSSATLPCGLLYIFLFAAMSVQSTAMGTAMVFVFWFATIPSLEILASLKSQISRISFFKQNSIRYGLLSVFFIYAVTTSWGRIQMVEVENKPNEVLYCH